MGSSSTAKKKSSSSSTTITKKRTADQANLSDESSQAKRPSIHPATKGITLSTKPKNETQYIYAVIQRSIPVYTGNYPEDNERDEGDEIITVCGPWRCESEVVWEWEEWDGPEASIFTFEGDGEMYGWWVDKECEMEGVWVEIRMEGFGEGVGGGVEKGEVGSWRRGGEWGWGMGDE
ncbi:hypothetical protein HYALB_00008533 [Hymenoscyphus albidus]|uniref:Uncharacterized protein n=1 Tax=Hymenoscyphus albidus TaxID=595503 RepID=A0A9N9PVE5_9HELO|nr:hypothetical protein HYALB_00008533 [Hymenoscyphus albidus]